MSSAAEAPGNGPRSPHDLSKNSLSSVLDHAEWGSARIRYFGDYEILREIARGGMGVVFLAWQKSLNRPVALKMILDGQLATADQVRRFYTEAKAAAGMDHPGIVPVYEVDQHEGQHYFSMGFVEGESLAHRLAGGPLPGRHAAELLASVADAIDYAHRRGVIHRDLKPSNILIDAGGHPRVTDFGLAKKVEADGELTASGQIMGTPSYMPPEQVGARRGAVGPAADVYALGATLYTAITGRPPFQAASPVDILRLVIDEAPVPPRRLNAIIDRDLETICLKCLEKQPSQRYASAADLAKDLRRYLEGRPIRARRVSRAERFRSWCRRNRALAVAIGLAAIFLMALAEVYVRLTTELSRSDPDSINRIGKAATAFVTVTPRGYPDQVAGSAFCIHPSGWFVTNEHVVRKQGKVVLTLNSGMHSEMRYAAQVIRTDKGLDLALLRVRNARYLPVLSLGSDKGLEERMEVTAFGFPFGTPLASGALGYPEVSVNVGRITALRHKVEALHRIQVDAELNPGNSGGPVLDRYGRVIGVVVEGIRGSRVNFAIPVSTVSRFVARPEVTFEPPPIGPANIRQPTEFEVQVQPLVAPSAPLSSELILKPSTGPERTVPMRSDGDVYRVTSALIPSGQGPATLHLDLRCDDGKREMTATDRSLTVGGREVQLSDVYRIYPGPTWRVILNDGRVITGAATGQETLPGRPGESADLGRVKDVTVTRALEPDFVEYSLVVREGDREIFRFARRVEAVFARIAEVARLEGHANAVPAVVPSADGRRFLSGSREGRLIVWDRATRRPIRTILAHPGQGWSIAFWPDGRSLLSDTGYGWRVMDEIGAGVGPDVNLGWPLLCAALSPDGKLLYTSSGELPREGLPESDSTIRVWEVAGRRELRRLTGTAGAVWSIAVSSDGRHVLAGGSGSAPVLWDEQPGGAEARRWIGHEGRINSVAFLPDGGRAVSGSADRTIRLWDVSSGRELHSLRGHRDAVYWVAVSPNGRRMLSSSLAGKELLLWDIESFELVARVACGDAGPTRGAFTTDGLEAAWGATDGIVRLYRLTDPG
jgi:serine/threonine protein kinase